MLENPTPAPTPDSSSSSAAAAAAVKRYAPPNQRHHMERKAHGKQDMLVGLEVETFVPSYLLKFLLNDRFDRTASIYGNDGEKFQHHSASRNIPVVDHGDVGTSDLLSENSRTRLISLEGCSRSEASQLLNDRWAAVMHTYNDPAVDLSERPVMYSGSTGSSWGQFKLPHQLMSPQNNAGSSPQFDFLSELRRAIRSGSANSDH